MFLIDSHCHINKLMEKIDDNFSDIMHQSYLNNVKFLLSVCTKLSDLDEMINISNNRKNIFFSCGIHPLNINSKISYKKLEILGSKKSVIAIGETGLDYFNNKNNKIKQQTSFLNHITISKILNKPIIIHSRNSAKDILEILKSEKNNLCGGIIHCFNYEEDIAKHFLNLGFYISFSGLITFKNAYYLKKIINYVPIERMLIETDSPYLSPEPFRGKINRPAYLKYIANFISLVKGIPIEILTSEIFKNFENLFNIKLINLI